MAIKMALSGNERHDHGCYVGEIFVLSNAIFAMLLTQCYLQLKTILHVPFDVEIICGHIVDLPHLKKNFLVQFAHTLRNFHH